MRFSINFRPSACCKRQQGIEARLWLAYRAGFSANRHSSRALSSALARRYRGQASTGALPASPLSLDCLLILVRLSRLSPPLLPPPAGRSPNREQARPATRPASPSSRRECRPSAPSRRSRTPQLGEQTGDGALRHAKPVLQIAACQVHVVGLAGDSNDQAGQGACAGRQALIAQHRRLLMFRRNCRDWAARDGPGAVWVSVLSAAAVAATVAAPRSWWRSRPFSPRSGRGRRLDAGTGLESPSWAVGRPAGKTAPWRG